MVALVTKKKFLRNAKILRHYRQVKKEDAQRRESGSLPVSGYTFDGSDEDAPPREKKEQRKEDGRESVKVVAAAPPRPRYEMVISNDAWVAELVSDII